MLQGLPVYNQGKCSNSAPDFFNFLNVYFPKIFVTKTKMKKSDNKLSGEGQCLTGLSCYGDRHSGGGGGFCRSPQERDNYSLEYYLRKIL
jgi:hypothetical protein